MLSFRREWTNFSLSSYDFLSPHDHGEGYSSDDTSVTLVFHQTNKSQDSAITWIEIKIAGLYYVDGWITATAAKGSGLFGTFDVNAAGEIKNVYISPLEHGSGYTDAVSLNVVYAGTNISQVCFENNLSISSNVYKTDEFNYFYRDT